MRALFIAVLATVLTGLVAPAYADGVEPVTTTLEVPINGRTNGQLCRAVQALGILPGRVQKCVAEARATRSNGWVTLSVLAGPIGSGPAQLAEAESASVELEPIAEPQALSDTTSSAEKPWWVNLAIIAGILTLGCGLFLALAPKDKALKEDLESWVEANRQPQTEEETETPADDSGAEAEVEAETSSPEAETPNPNDRQPD